MESIWTQTARLPVFPSLEGEHETEAAVIGGGLTGLLTAHLLRRAGADVTVLEADRLGSGQTGGTTAKLTAQHGLRYARLIREQGMDAARQYAQANLAAVERLRRLTREWDMDCGMTDCDTFLYTTGAPGPLEEEFDACRALGMDVSLTRDTELPFPALALGLRNQARFHPLRLLAVLAEDLRIYEQSRVLEVRGRTLKTARGTLTAKTVIFACHYPFINLPGFYFIRQHQERSYVLALENAAAPEHCYLGIGEDGFSFRAWGKYLLFGGGSHRTGDNREGGQFETLRQAARRYWPNCHVAAAWSAQDCVPMDGVPYIGRYAAGRPEWLVATGFQKWGMSSAMAAAEILSDMAQGRAPMGAGAVFSPQRFRARASAKQLASDTAWSLRGLVGRRLAPGQVSAGDVPPGHGAVAVVDGKKLGVYRDENGEVYAVSLKCPHLGCQLEWNPAEKSWDCPCHGSRFDIHGRLLDGPAQTSLQ